VAAGPFHERAFADLAKSLGVRMIAQRSRHDVRELYSLSDVFLAPTPLDTFALVILEAMAMGLPVVATHFAGVSELLTDGNDALLLKSCHDPSEIAGCCEMLMDVGMRERIAERGWKLAQTMPWKAAAKKHLVAYEYLAPVQEAMEPDAISLQQEPSRMAEFVR
jgi:glycosyltransferase involved in cell wall biosynthesis